VTVKIFNGTGTAGTVAQTLTATRSGTSWSTTAAALAQGTYTAQATQTDAGANTGTSNANTFSVNAPPSVTINQRADQADPTKTTPIRWTVTFSESVTGFTAGDLNRTGSSTGGSAAVTGSGTTYEVSLTGTPSNGTIAFDVPSGRAQDASGLGNTASTSTDNVVTFDTAGPSVTLTAPANGSRTADTTPTISGGAGGGATDSNTVTVQIFNGTGTGGTVAQTLTATRSGTSWSTTAAALTEGIYTARATQTDVAGNTGTSNANTFTIDTTGPALTTLDMLDNDSDGKVDRVRATFNDTLAASTLTSQWTLSGVPSNGTLSSVSTSGTVATLVLNEGAAAADTAVGAFTVALAANASGIRDTLGNPSSFAATAPRDLTSPVLMTATSTGGTTQNRLQAGDTLTLTFSEPLLPTSIPTSLTVTESRGGLLSGSAQFVVPGFIEQDAISTSYLGGFNSSGSATSTSVIASNGNRSVTVTLGTVTTTGSGVGTGSGGVNVTPNAALKDIAGNAAATVARTLNPLF
jgi:hypothetical protein